MVVQAGAKIFIKHTKLKKHIYTLRDNITTIPSPNCWDLVGGGINKGENPLEAALREKEEEIALELFGIKFIAIFQGESRDEQGNIIGKMPIYVFKGFTNTDPSKIEIIAEGQYPGYFSLNEILDQPNTVPRLKYFVKHYNNLLQ